MLASILYIFKLNSLHSFSRVLLHNLWQSKICGIYIYHYDEHFLVHTNVNDMLMIKHCIWCRIILFFHHFNLHPTVLYNIQSCAWFALLLALSLSISPMIMWSNWVHFRSLHLALNICGFLTSSVKCTESVVAMTTYSYPPTPPSPHITLCTDLVVDP